MPTLDPRRASAAVAACAAALHLTACLSSAQTTPPAGSRVATAAEPAETSSLAPLLEGYDRDRDALSSFYGIRSAPTRIERLERFDREWTTRLEGLDFDALELAARVDHVLLSSELTQREHLRARQRTRLEETAELVPFAAEILALEEARWTPSTLDPRAVAERLTALAEAVEAVHERVRAPAEEDGDAPEPGEQEEDAGDEDEPPLLVDPVLALRAAERVDELGEALEEWSRHYREFLPGFAWWTDVPRAAAEQALEAYAKRLREEVAGQKGEDDDPLVGDPIGREALLADIAHELLPYSPEELLAIGEEQLAWCEAELRRAAAELGCGEDWKAALERVKQQHVEPGEQDELVAGLAHEMVAFLEERELVTIPELCKETWRVRMLDAEGQRTLPFAAYGGQSVLVAYPTSGMDHESKLMSMRGNNVHFTRCVTPHELIPGHHLQAFQAERWATHRRPFGTPFLVEGWALYWELREWELGWPRGPEDRIGMLFWRMHRAARIVVSLRFHLGLTTPAEMVDFLVERVGHERDNATSEVRRYVGGSYGPLYQCAYLIGGLQLWALHAELVGSGRLGEREFHDAVLRQNAIPIELLRAALGVEELTAGHRAAWRFAGDPLEAPEPTEPSDR